ncbi:MAG: SurA N-terminal domain-containing protein [Pseudomonadota bacterium]
MKYYIVLAILSLGFSSGAFAKEDSIVALVNDEPITLYELEERGKMVKFFNKIGSLTAEQTKIFNHSVLEGLIDETLISQQQESFGVNVSEEEIDNAISSIEERNKMSKGYMKSSLASQNISNNAFRSKIKAELLKSKIVSTALMRNVAVTAGEVEAAVLAQNSKDAEVSLKVLTAKNNSHKTYNQMTVIASTLPSCKKINSRSYKDIGTLVDLDTKLSNLEPKVQNIIKDLAVGENSDAIKVGEDLKIFLLCSKKILDFTADENNYVINFLGNKKLLLRAKKYQEDLRKKSYIKILI